jgi:hypothetical protein
MALTKVTYSMIEGAVVNAVDYGAIGDGITNNLNAFAAALLQSQDKVLYIPSGTYVINFSTQNALQPLANTKIVGEGKGKTILVFQRNSSLDTNCFNVTNNNFGLQDLTIRSQVVTGGLTGSIAIVAAKASFIDIDNCELDGTMTNAGAVLSHSAFAVKFGETGSVTDTNLFNCDVHNFAYCLLKANIWTSNQNRINVSNCNFYSNYYEDATFNSPRGTMANVVVQNCNFYSGAGSGASLNQLYTAFASVSNFVVSGNTYSGTVFEAIHVEENSINGSIENNVINVDIVAADGAAIQLVENNIAGVFTSPTNISITGNAINKAGTAKEADKNGISIVFDTTPTFPGNNLVIANNAVQNFYSGILANSNAQNNVFITGNTVENCENGLYLVEAQLDVSNNTTIGCDVGVYSFTSTTLQNHIFNSCVVNVDANDYPVMLVNPAYVFAAFSSTAATPVYKNITPLGANDRLYGSISAYSFSEANVFSYGYWTGDILWDGTGPLVSTVKTSASPFSALVENVVNNSSNLAISITTGTNQTNVRCSAKINGSILIAP